MATRGAVDGVALVSVANDVADVVAIDQQLICLLDRAAVGPRDKARRAQDDRGEQAVVGVGDPACLAVDVARVDEPVRLVQVDDVRHIHQARRPPCDPRARLVAADDGVDTTEPPRVEGHQERGRGHLHRLAEGEPAGQLGQERLHPDLADEVRITARRVDRRRVALDVVAPPAQAKYLFDDNPLAAARVSEATVEDGDPARAFLPHVAPAADEEKAQHPERQGVGGGEGVVEDDRPGGDARGESESAAKHQRPRDLEVAQIAGTCRHSETEEQSGIGGHRFQRRDRDADRYEQQREVECVDHECQHGETREARCQLRRPEPPRSGPEREDLAGDRRGEPRWNEPPGETRPSDPGAGERGAEHRRQQRDRQGRGAR